MYRNKKSGLLGSVITIIILILIVIFSNREANTSFFENIANKLVMPVQNGLTYLKNKTLNEQEDVREFLSTFVEIVENIYDNCVLNTILKELNAKEISLKEILK